jgi:RNA polymerase sigma-70 factor (ECF subfamily)
MTVEALRHGSVDVLDVLLDEYGRELQRVAYLILHDTAAAEDVVADTLITALGRGASLRDAGTLRAWLLKIAVNHALQHRRRSIRIVQLDLLPESADMGDPTDAADRAALWQGVAGLPPRTRAAIVLHYYSDLPVVDVAVALGVSANTVKSQLKSGLQHLRSALADAPTTLPEARHA